MVPRKPVREIELPDQDQFQLLVQSIKDYAIYHLDPEGYIISWNAGAERIKGYSTDEILGCHYSIFYSPEDVERNLPKVVLGTALRTGRYEGEGWRRRKDGSRFWAGVTVTPLIDKTGKHVGFAKVTRDITERVRYEALLNEAQRIASIGSWEWDIGSNRVDWSENLFQIYGVSRERFPASFEGFLSLVHPEDREHTRKIIEKAFGDRQPFAFYHRIVRPDGSVRVLHARGKVETAAGGLPTKMTGTGQDVTELRQAQEALERANLELERRVEERTMELSRAYSDLVRETSERKRAEEWFSIVLRSIGDAVIATDEKGHVVFMNRVAEYLTGWPQAEATGKHLDEIFRIVNEETRTTVESPVAKVIREGTVVGLANHTVLIARQGNQVPIDDSGAPIRDESGRLMGIVLVFHDVAEQKRAEASIRESEERFRYMADHAPVMVWMSGSDKRLTFFNRQWLEFTGRALEQELGHGWVQSVHPDDRPRCLEVYASSFDAGKSFKMEHRLRRRDGAYRWILNHGIPRRASDGTFLGFIGSCIDITDNRLERERQGFLAEAGKILNASLDYVRSLDEIARLLVPALADWCAIDIVDEEGVPKLVAVQHKDPAAADDVREMRRRFPFDPARDIGVDRVLRTGRSELHARVDDELLKTYSKTPEALAAARKLASRSAMVVPMTARGKTLGVMTLALSGPGERFYTDGDLSFIEEVAHRAAVAVDNARLYENAQKAIRVRDEFLSIASHELRTPLTSLQLQLQTVLHLARKGKTPPPEKVVQMVDTGFRQGERLGRLVNDLLDLSRLSAGRFTLEREELDLAELVAEVADRFKANFESRGYRVTLRADPPARGRWDRLRLEQVVTNLISNAIRYGEGNPIEISVQPGSMRHRLIVHDRGMGMPPEFQARIFKPFERSVSSGYGGLGLGLYIVRQIVEAHGGTISVESRLGAGSTFTVELPVDQVAGN